MPIDDPSKPGDIPTRPMADVAGQTVRCAMPNMEVNDCQLLELLGRGGFGEVWKATELTTNRLVAVKLIPRTVFHYSEIKTREMAQKEAVLRVELRPRIDVPILF